MKDHIKSSQELYTLVDWEFEEIKNIFFKLEKVFFSLSPIYDALYIKLENLIKILQKEKTPVLVGKIKELKKNIEDLWKERGYEPEIFQELYILLNKIQKSSASDIISAESLKNKILLFQYKAKNFLTHSSKEGIDTSSQSKKFLMVSDNRTRFLVPFKEKVWQKKLNRKAYRDQIKIQVEDDDLTGLYLFNSLIRASREKRSSERYAVLVIDENGEKKGFLADHIEGMIYLNPRLFLNKIDYLRMGSYTKAFVYLRGQRYFIEKL